MKIHVRGIALLLAAFVVFTCAGCAAAGAESLYALPQMSDEYLQLEELIAQRIQDSGEYAAPAGGRNRQSVQLHDLDGDGISEAVAFLADSAHTPNVCVYRQDEEGEYYLFVAIEGAGSAVSSVEYADLTGDGGEEMILAWQIAGDMRLLSVYSLGQSSQAQLLSADCSEFLVGDLDGDGGEELLNLSIEYGGASTLTRYVFSPDGDVSQSQAQLSEGITKVLRVRTGLLSDEVTALFVESRWGEEELITDVFITGGGLLTNITLGSAGRSNTLRPEETFASDINGDRVMEIPESSGDVLNWYALDSSGRKTMALSSYHSAEGDWYLALDDVFLSGSLTVSGSDSVPGESAVTFSVDWGEEERTALLTIYTLTGENRLDRAEEDGRFILAENGPVVYAGRILAEDLLTEDSVTRNFNLIYPEWQTGDL